MGNLMRLDKDKCNVLNLQQAMFSINSLGDEGIEISSTEKDLGALVDEKLPMSWHVHSSQHCPWLHPKQCGQQVKGGDSVPLLHCHETPPGALHPALGSPAQKGRGPVRMGPEEGD
ncbi:hypothetical protein DUI87_18343 [Hirundo rustica rustica]|uniref:Uncharacterized protein n=1 Tax=Hirundo rustica rustica TaxID=333673 RepID=A0A3M0JWC6_HIRRU|nr:hypothetical protein DUI87_18343 [Hirundo rustica rustica]